jgi:type I restriction enzyme, S subunit
VSGLPEGWVEASLGDVAGRGQYGWTTKAADEGSVKFLRTTDITQGEIDWARVPYCDEPPDDLQKYRLRKNDIVISRAGSVGFSKLIDDAAADAVFASYLIRFSPADGVEPRYLAHFLRSEQYWQQVRDVSAGVALANVNAKKLSAIRVPLAPFAEQKRIADKLDRLLSTVDTCKARLDSIPDILKLCRRAVLAVATSGELTEAWRATQTSMASWRSEKFGDLVINHDNKRVPIKSEDRKQRRGEYPYYGAFGAIDCIDDFKYDGTYLLIAEDGKNLESRDRPITNIATGRFWVNNHAHVVQAKDGVDLSYLQICLESPTLDLGSFLTGIDQVKLTRAAMERIPIDLPSLDEQREIVHRVASMCSTVERVTNEVISARARLVKLTNSLFDKAFRGELLERTANNHRTKCRLHERA